MQNRIPLAKIEKYHALTSKALAIAKKSIHKTKQNQAKEIITMVTCYLKDAEHFQQKGDYINSFAALNYAHGWLDAGARLKIFNITDNNLFTI